MLNIFIEFSSFCAMLTSICRLFILPKKNLNLTAILFLLGLACELRNPHIFSTIPSASRAGLCAHILTLCAATLMIQFAYSLYATNSLLNKNNLLSILHRKRWLIFILASIALILLYRGEQHRTALLELSHSFYTRVYWLVFAAIYCISAITILYTTYLFDFSELNSQIKICVYSIRIFALLNIYYSVIKFITQLHRFPPQFIELNSGLSIGIAILILTIAGALPVLTSVRKKNLKYDH